VTTYSIKHWLQLEMAREQVAVFELTRSDTQLRAATAK